MKIFLLISIFYISFGVTFSQTDDPVEVETSFKKLSDTEYDIIFKFYIEDQWHLYSQYNPEEASSPMVIKPSVGESGYELIGKAKESETHTEFSEIWNMDEIFFVDECTLTQRVKINDPKIRQISINIEAQVCKEYCLPFDGDYVIALDNGKTIDHVASVDEKSKILRNSLKIGIKNPEILNKTIYPDSKSKTKNKNPFKLFILCFIGGIVAFLTPCIFPLVPLTVSYFTKHNKTKRGIYNAILYGFFIFLIFVILSLPFHFIDSLDPGFLNTISSNIWLNLFFFIIFIFFSGSFFGYYHLALPHSWTNKVDKASNIGGIIGIFFMALTLAIVSFSCTGPILGSLLAGSISSDFSSMDLTIGMGGFGLALALPFSFFALFPRLLNKIPKSGNLINTFLILLGFVELALAFKFLSNADLVGRWGIFKREIFIGIWIIILILASLFLFGFLNFPSSKRIKRVALIRILLGIILLGGGVYLAPGLTKKPIWDQSLLSGFAPPQFYSIYNYKNDCPLALNCFKNYDKGLAYAKKVGKPILLDFTGWSCVNCRKMEENVWSDPKVYKTISNKYVLISLYVDDNSNYLPKDQKFDFIKKNGKIKKINTYGDKWATMQAITFKNASQPFYILMSPDLKILNTPQQYTDKNTYLKWLKTGIHNFKKTKTNNL